MPASKCLHGRESRRCVQCGGHSMCMHKRERRRCKECNGSAMCEHAREKTRCRVCVGGSVCAHSKQRVRCPTCSPVKYLFSLMRNHTSILLRRNNIKKSHKTVEYLGCSAFDFSSHIRHKMCQWNLTHEVKMTLENIHLDHIKPCSSAMSVHDINTLSHYTNIQPLLKEDNLHKTNKWNSEDELFWSQHILYNSLYLNIYWPVACDNSQNRSFSS